MPKITKETVLIAQTYQVRGFLPFPIDMLRYDSCWPAGEADADVIQRTVLCLNTGGVVVELRARQPLTKRRWASFGWEVLKSDES